MRRGWTGAALLLLLVALVGCSSSEPAGGSDAGWSPGQPLTLDVSGVFTPGTVVRDVSSGATATVGAQGTVTLTPAASGVTLLERDGATATPFTWANATVYFLLTDRFFDGDPSNDHSYGRQPDGADEIGTWHGGDWAGVTAKLDHIAGLGATAIWISPIVEQVHGWVAGGSGDFKHYGYAGYWALDFTRLDQNFGAEADLTTLVDTAHGKGLRVLADVVLNHPGYATGDDLVTYLPTVFYDMTGSAFQSFHPGAGQTWANWNDLVNYTSTLEWKKWWSPLWIRAGFPQFDPPGNTDQTLQLAFLPDFKTESPADAGRPLFFAGKPDTAFTEIPGARVRDYLVKWHTDWLRQFGFDGFRCDTAKNVELDSWKALKDAALPALAAWKTANPTKKLDDAPFWMTGEVYGHGVEKDAYYTSGGFDSLINFDFQSNLLASLLAHGSLVAGAADLETLYSRYAAQIAGDPSFGILSYLSSHDTLLFFHEIGESASLQRQAGTALLLAPGAVQVFYGDETGRRLGKFGSDQTQGTRSDMNWTTIDGAVLAHWQLVGNFRKKHGAIGAGQHRKLQAPDGVYAFGRTWKTAGVDDAVAVILSPSP